MNQIESFINYCDDMMIATEGVKEYVRDKKDFFRNAKENRAVNKEYRKKTRKLKNEADIDKMSASEMVELAYSTVLKDVKPARNISKEERNKLMQSLGVKPGDYTVINSGKFLEISQRNKERVIVVWVDSESSIQKRTFSVNELRKLWKQHVAENSTY